MTDFPVYDVTNTCRGCGNPYASKSFLAPKEQDTDRRFGFCPDCLVLEEAKMNSLQQPPKDHGKPPESDRRHEDRRQDFRRRAAGDD